MFCWFGWEGPYTTGCGSTQLPGHRCQAELCCIACMPAAAHTPPALVPALPLLRPIACHKWRGGGSVPTQQTSHSSTGCCSLHPPACCDGVPFVPLQGDQPVGEDPFDGGSADDGGELDEAAEAQLEASLQRLDRAVERDEAGMDDDDDDGDGADGACCWAQRRVAAGHKRVRAVRAAALKKKKCRTARSSGRPSCLLPTGVPPGARTEVPNAARSCPTPARWARR